MFPGSPETERAAYAEWASLPEFHEERNSQTSRRMYPFKLVCIELSAHLTHDEASELRANGTLPDWFRSQLVRLVAVRRDWAPGKG
jgi:hypothetical protein